MSMPNTFPKWKYFSVAVILLLGFLYAIPNIYGEDPALQISGKTGYDITQTQIKNLTKTLDQQAIAVKAIKQEVDGDLLIRFLDVDTQLKAKDIVKASMGENYVVALNLAPATPKWLEVIRATPLKLGLDLRGGVHFLMEIDVASAVDKRLESYMSDIRSTLREKQIHYNNIKKDVANYNIYLEFSNEEKRNAAFNAVKAKVGELNYEKVAGNGKTFAINASVTPVHLTEIRNYTVEQTITTLRNRVNELGVAEALVQRQGLNQIVVELPGIQDTARAKEILGKTATLDFLMRDHEHDVERALNGRVPPGSRVYHMRDGTPVLLKKRTILTGDSITGASTGFDQDQRPAVNIRLGGGNIGLFKKTTRESIGRQMAVVYVETSTAAKEVNGKVEKQTQTKEDVISLATIQSALGNSFQITGLKMNEAQNLALLLRAGALPATISIVEERTIGPSLGKDNINKGVLSIQVGLLLVLIFMAAYYRLFGLIANIALVFDLVLLLALLSVIGATLTLPGIAGIVLTLGMAVDANVLIFERIREEMRRGMTKHAAIHRGFDRAFQTILDSNLTTLIVAIILFSIGTGPVRGFAVTLSIGLITSMFTAVTCTRAMVNLVYGGKSKRALSIGI